MFERFKIEVSQDSGQPSQYACDVLNFLIEVTLMAKLITPRMIDLILRLVGEDDDGLLSGAEMHDMLMRIERLFCQE